MIVSYRDFVAVALVLVVIGVVLIDRNRRRAAAARALDAVTVERPAAPPVTDDELLALHWAVTSPDGRADR